MNRIAAIACVFVCAASQFVSAQVSEFDREVQLGIAAYKKAEYATAVEHLRRAVALDPASATAWLRLGNAYRDWYCPCDCDVKAECDANEKRRTDAIDAYQSALNIDPSNVEALNSLGYLVYVHAKSDEAATYFRKALQVRPTNAQALYSLAAVEFNQSFQLRAETKAKLGMGMNKPLIALVECTQVRAANLVRVEEAMSLLTRTDEVSSLADSMSFLAGLYRERADIQCGDRRAHDKDVKTAKEWARRACQAFRERRRTPPGPYPWPPPPPPPPGMDCDMQR